MLYQKFHASWPVSSCGTLLNLPYHKNPCPLQDPNGNTAITLQCQAPNRPQRWPNTKCAGLGHAILSFAFPFSPLSLESKLQPFQAPLRASSSKPSPRKTNLIMQLFHLQNIIICDSYTVHTCAIASCGFIEHKYFLSCIS